MALEANLVLVARDAENSAVPVKVFSINGSEIRVWTPSRAGSAASSLSTANALATATLPTVTTGSLPRIVTPGG